MSENQPAVLDFEKKINEIEEKIKMLNTLAKDSDVDIAVLGQGVQHLDLFFDFVDLFFKIQNGGLVFTHSSFLFPIFLQLVL